MARAIALRQLAIAPRTKAQLADILARRGVPEEVAAGLLDRFEEVDLVDDEEFARMWVRSRHAGRGLSRRALAHELHRRGVEDETARGALAEIGPEEELTAARELVRCRLAHRHGDDPPRRARRLAAMLARKGYGAEIALRAIQLEVDDLEVDDVDAAAFPDDPC